MISPQKKKSKIENLVASHSNALKRDGQSESSPKRTKTDENCENNVDIQVLKRKNFVKACEQVSCKAYLDFGFRFQLIYLPPCVDSNSCNHVDSGKMSDIKMIPDYAEQSIRIELKSYTWYEALEICEVCLTPEQYLTAEVLKEIVEIMMNAQDNDFEDYTLEDLINRCQEILSNSFSFHPPCVMKTLRNLYKDFLTSPMSLKDKTYSNRTEFECDKGIVKYCFNRLEYELSLDSKDDPIVDKEEHLPEEMTQSVKGLHWQKEKFEIFETLNRCERIKRLMAVLESLIELLQFDLVIWYSRYKSDLGSHMMRSHKPLMAFVLWSNNVLYTGVVNNNCRQIFRIFAYMVHLQYFEEYIRIMATWLNIIIQTFYICETNSNSDYPNIGKYSTKFAKEFYKIIADMPGNTIIKILENIHPSFMQHLVGLCHIQTLLSTSEEDTIKILTWFVREKRWKTFIEGTTDIVISKGTVMRPKKVKDLNRYLKRICKPVFEDDDEEIIVYPKLDPSTIVKDTVVERSHVIHALYITIDAYLDAYSVQNVQETLDQLNDELEKTGQIPASSIPENSSYSVSEHYIKKYRSIYQNLTEFISATQNLDKEEAKEMKVFEKLGLL